MKKNLKATAAVIAILTATGAARADELSDLRAQAHRLQKQNEMLAKRIAKIEKRQAKEQAEIARASSARPPAKNFLDYLPSIKGPAECAPLSLDGPLTFCGITLFGAVDAGLGYASHGAPVNPDMYWGNVAVRKFNRGGYFGIVPNGLSQTTLGIKGEVHLYGDWSGVFHASTGINPQSGHLADATKSIIDNNGVPNFAQSLNAGGTRGGQAFNDELYIGVKSHTLGELTFGRQKSLSNQIIVGKYDPAGGAYNYSMIGYSGDPVAGGGITDYGRIDNLLKYQVGYGPVHFGAMYKFAANSAGAGGLSTVGVACGMTAGGAAIPCNNNSWAWQLDGGFSYMGFNIDVVGGHFNQAVKDGGYGPVGSQMIKLTSADTDDITVGANYTWQQFKFFAGWAHDELSNAKDPIGPGATLGQGSYVAGGVDNNAYHCENGEPCTQVLDTEWGGIQYHYNPQTVFTVAYYHLGQGNWGRNDAADCALPATYAAGTANDTRITGKGPRPGSCSGNENWVSGYVDYHFTKRFDVYGGITYTNVDGGLASGYINPTDIAPTAGLRFKF